MSGSLLMASERAARSLGAKPHTSNPRADMACSRSRAMTNSSSTMSARRRKGAQLAMYTNLSRLFDCTDLSRLFGRGRRSCRFAWGALHADVVIMAIGGARAVAHFGRPITAVCNDDVAVGQRRLSYSRCGRRLQDSEQNACGDSKRKS